MSGSSKPMPKQEDIKKDGEEGMEKKWSLSNIYANTRQISPGFIRYCSNRKSCGRLRMALTGRGFVVNERACCMVESPIFVIYLDINWH